jgi:hypothetical protein
MIAVGTVLNLGRVTNVKIDATTGTGEFGWTNVNSAATLHNGKYTLRFTGVTGFTYGAMIMYESGTDPAPAVTLGSATTVPHWLVDTSAITINVNAPYISSHRLVKSVAVSTSAMHEATAVTAASYVTPISSSVTTSSSMTSSTGTGTGARLFTLMRPDRNYPTSSSTVRLTLTTAASSAVMAANYIDWKAPNGPFANITVGGSSDAVTEWPVLTPGTPVTGQFASTATGAGGVAADGNNVWRVSLPANKLWYSLKFETTNVADATSSRSYGSLGIQAGTNPTRVSSSPSFNGAHSVNVAVGPATFTNPRFAAYDPTSTSAVFDLTGILKNLNSEEVYVQLSANGVTTAGGSGGSPITYSFTLSVTMDSVVLECSDDSDCISTAANHRSVRASRSANGDATRLRRCSLSPDSTTPSKPVTRCLECVADCDCGEGQYCHRDPGVCTSASGSYYTCDRDSSQLTGLCAAKDPTNSIIGASCRESTGIAYSAAQAIDASWPVQNSAGSQYIVGNPLSADLLRQVQSGNGFCGGLRYFNSSYVPASIKVSEAGSGLTPNNTVRAALWTGSCINGVCHECSPSSTTACRSCIGGHLLDTVTVDGTARTLGDNITASISVGVLVMLIFICLLGFLALYCLQSWHNEDVRQRKLKYQKAEHLKAKTSYDEGQPISAKI